jgi:hypothetical protein
MHLTKHFSSGSSTFQRIKGVRQGLSRAIGLEDVTQERRKEWQRACSV